MPSPLRLVPVRPTDESLETLRRTGAGKFATPIRNLVVTLFVIETFLAVVNFAMVSHERSGPYRPAADTEFKAPQGPFNLKHEFFRLVRSELDLDRESNLTTWFSSTQFSVIGFLALVLVPLSADLGWLWIGLGFLYLSADELAQLHEWAGSVLWHSNFRLGFIMPPYPWLLMFAPPLLAFGFWMARFLHRELSSDRRLSRLAIGGIACLAMTFPLELLGGKLEAISGRLVRIESTFEESFELVGATLILYVLLMMVAAHFERRREPVAPVTDGHPAA